MKEGNHMPDDCRPSRDDACSKDSDIVACAPRDANCVQQEDPREVHCDEQYPQARDKAT